jgi:hypothetical protein
LTAVELPFLEQVAEQYKKEHPGAAVSPPPVEKWLVETLGIGNLPKELQQDVVRSALLAAPLVAVGLGESFVFTRSGPVEFGLGIALGDLVRPFVRRLVTQPIDNALQYYYRTEVPAVRQVLTAVREGGLGEAEGREALRRTGLSDSFVEPLLQGALKTRQANEIRARYDLRAKQLDEAMADWEAQVKPVEDDLNWVISELRSLDRQELNDSLAEALDYDRDELADVESVYRARRRKELAARRRGVTA